MKNAIRLVGAGIWLGIGIEVGQKLILPIMTHTGITIAKCVAEEKTKKTNSEVVE